MIFLYFFVGFVWFRRIRLDRRICARISSFFSVVLFLVLTISRFLVFSSSSRVLVYEYESTRGSFIFYLLVMENIFFKLVPPVRMGHCNSWGFIIFALSLLDDIKTANIQLQSLIKFSTFLGKKRK